MGHLIAYFGRYWAKPAENACGKTSGQPDTGQNMQNPV